MLVVQHESFFRRPKKLFLIIHFENLPPFFASVPERSRVGCVGRSSSSSSSVRKKRAKKGGEGLNDVVFFVALVVGRRGGRRQ